MKPTIEAINLLQDTFDFFNNHFFEAQLPPAMITYQRKSKAMGYHAPERWHNREADQAVSEIALNPDLLDRYPDMEAAQTLLHEMCHLWQWHFGSPSRGGYHNREWAEKMLEVGLTPSSTGKPGGKQTGQSVADYPTPNGRFLDIFPQLVANGFVLKWVGKVQTVVIEGGGPAEEEADPEEAAATSSKNKTKYTCDGCKANVWGKPQLNVICGDCEEQMKPQ